MKHIGTIRKGYEKMVFLVLCMLVVGSLVFGSASAALIDDDVNGTGLALQKSGQITKSLTMIF